MSEPIWCNIDVKIPKSWMTRDGEPYRPDFIEGLSYALCNGETHDQDLDPADAEHMVWHFDGEGNYGLGDDDVQTWLSWLVEHNVPFYASDDPKYEYDGTWCLFNGFEYVAQGTKSGGGDILLDRHTYADIKAGKCWAKTVEEYFSPPTLDACSIAHLPAECPTDEREEVNNASNS